MKVTGEDVRAVLVVVAVLASWLAFVFVVGFTAGVNWWVLKAAWNVAMSILP